MAHKKRLNLLLLPLASFSIVLSIKTNVSSAHIEGMFGNLHERISTLKTNFTRHPKETSEASALPQSKFLSWILYGKSGTGKTETVKKVTQEAKAEVISYTPEELSEEIARTKNPARTVIEIFARAHQKSIKTGKVVVIVFDDLDLFIAQNPKIAGVVSNAIWKQIDKYHDSINLRLVLISHDLHALAPDLIHRSVHFELKLPTYHNRKKVISSFAQKYDLEISKRTLETIAIFTRHYSYADLKGLIQKAANSKNNHKNLPMLQSYFSYVIKSPHVLKETSKEITVALLGIGFMVLCYRNKNRIVEIFESFVVVY